MKKKCVDARLKRDYMGEIDIESDFYIVNMLLNIKCTSYVSSSHDLYRKVLHIYKFVTVHLFVDFWPTNLNGVTIFYFGLVSNMYFHHITLHSSPHSNP